MSAMGRDRQVYSVGNYLMTGKVLGKGHFARVEEATHRIIGKKVAIKVIDLTSIKEEYARRHLHREPRVMAKLRHPCIAALYETMMHGPRLYVVMEAAGGGDLCALVLRARGLPELRARALAAQLVSAVRHMHTRQVVHRDLKMENIMLDSTKQFIKIVDFGLSNVWTAGGALRTPCGSLEYAAPELFDGRRYGPEVDLWSIGVIVYGMVTGALPFTAADGTSGGQAAAAGGSRPQLRAAIARGFGRRQRVALASFSTECKTFIQHLLEPRVALRMRIVEAARHRWLRRPGRAPRAAPLPDPRPDTSIYRQIAELTGQNVVDVVAHIKNEPFGPLAGMFNIKSRLQQMASTSADLLWGNEDMAETPREGEQQELIKLHNQQEITKLTPSPPNQKPTTPAPKPSFSGTKPQPKSSNIIKPMTNTQKMSDAKIDQLNGAQKVLDAKMQQLNGAKPLGHKMVDKKSDAKPKSALPSPRVLNRSLFLKKQVSPYKPVADSGDGGPDPRLPSIDEHTEDRRATTSHKTITEDRLRLNSCPIKDRRIEFYRRGGDGLPSWKASGVVPTPPARILLQTTATAIKRASLGNLVSPHSSSNSHCKSDRAAPAGWYQSSLGKNAAHLPLQRFRRTTPMK